MGREIMDVRNCFRCGKIYNYDGFRICPTCRREEEVDFQRIKEYLYEYPGANISEVHEATKIDTNKIIEFLREGRLEISEGSNLILECENCGVSIKTGRFCDKCASNLRREFGQAIGTPRSNISSHPREKERFRVIDRHEKRR